MRGTRLGIWKDDGPPKFEQIHERVQREGSVLDQEGA